MSRPHHNVGVIYEKNAYAGFFKRVAAAAVDIVVIVLASAGCLYIAYHLFAIQHRTFGFDFFFTFFLSIFYLAVLKRSKYRTVGYVLMGMKIVDLSGERPQIHKMILRVLLLILGPFQYAIDILWLPSEATRQTLRDKYVGTYVVRRDAVPVGQGRLRQVELGVLGWHLMYREVNESLIK